MGPHALAICWLAGLPYQDMVQEVTQQPLTARTETRRGGDRSPRSSRMSRGWLVP